LRWFCVGNPVRAIVIVTRGKQTKQVKTISKTNTPEAWESWQPVLAEWRNERKTNKRTNHEKFGKGEMK